MNIKKLMLFILFLSPIISLAQSNSEEENFKTNVMRKVIAYNAEIEKQSEALKIARANKSADTVTIQIQRKELVKKCFQVPQDYIKAKPSSPYASQALGMLGSGKKGSPITVNELESLFNLLSPEAKGSANGRAYAAQLEAWKERDQKKN